MPALSPAQGNSIINRGFDILKEGARLTSGTDPNYIRDAQPNGPFEAVPLAIARQGCRRWADKGGNGTERREARMERACRSYLDDIGYGTGPTLKLPFRGGQCVGVPYTVTYRYNVIDTGGGTIEPPIESTYGILGPLQRFEGDGAPDFQRIITVNGYGTEYPRSGSCPQGCFRNIKVISVIRNDGQPDTCGNPSPVYGPSLPPPGPRPTREPFTIAPGIDVDVDVTVNVDGSLTVNIGTGPISIDPFDEPTDVLSDLGGGTIPGDVGAAGVGGVTGVGGNAEGEAPAGKVLTGLKMTLISTPASPSQYKADIFRGSAYIYMGTSTGLDLDYAGQMLSNNQFIFAEKENLTHWKVSSNQGYSWGVTPYYKDV